MMTIPKVSVIVPVYNVEKYLQHCMDSLLNQTLKDIEIILVDDGSPDNCPAMCDEFARQDCRVRVIHKENEGAGYARNSGLEIATGEYITLVDSDDYVELNAYQKLYCIAMNTKVDVIYFSFQRFCDQGDTWKTISSDKEIRYQTKEAVRGLMLDIIANCPKAKSDRNIESSSCFALYSNDIIKRNGIKFNKLIDGEDMMFNLEYLLNSFNVIYIPDVFYNYRMNQSSQSRTVRPDRITHDYLLYQCLLDILNKNNFGIDGYLRATRIFIGYSRTHIRQYIHSSLSKMEKMHWTKKVVNNSFWKEIATSYPYMQLPLKYALHFYFLYKGFYRLLYYYSKLGSVQK